MAINPKDRLIFLLPAAWRGENAVGDHVGFWAVAAANSWYRGVKKFGRFSKRLYLCTPFTENRQNGLYERRVGQSVKTPPFHGGMRGSTPLRGT